MGNPEPITTVQELIGYLKTFDPKLYLDVRYDSGYGSGGFIKNFKIEINKNTKKPCLRIDAS